MCTKRNEATGVRCHRTMNLQVSIASTGLWALCESLRRHMLNILWPYISPDV
jgi:hypothetical protein